MGQNKGINMYLSHTLYYFLRTGNVSETKQEDLFLGSSYVRIGVNGTTCLINIQKNIRDIMSGRYSLGYKVMISSVFLL